MHCHLLLLLLSCNTLSAPPASSGGADNVEGGPASGTGSGPSKPSASASLVQWTEVPNFPGMICSLSQATSTPVVMFFRPEVIQVHELKALSSKSKVHRGGGEREGRGRGRGRGRVECECSPGASKCKAVMQAMCLRVALGCY